MLVSGLLTPGPAVFAQALSAPAEIQPDAAPTGRFTASSTMAELTNEDTEAFFHWAVPGDGVVEWDIYVPESYSAEKPLGIMVNVSPSDKGSIPHRWKKVMDQNNLIWIGANHSGNQAQTARRILFAVLATVWVQRNYAVDLERVYISGLSGGGKVSSMVATDFANLFKGAIFICGVNKPREEKPALLETIRDNRYVFLTGSKDFNLQETRRVYHFYEDLDVKNIKLMVVPKMAHENPSPYKFEQAIQYLDAGLDD